MNVSRRNFLTRRFGRRPPKLFISYRRRFDHASARLLKGQLTEAFGEGAVFRDVDDIRPGDAFPETIRKAVETCDVFLALVSPGWLGVIGELQNPDDFVRREIAAALARPVALIPVLLGGAEMPEAGALPEEIKDFASRQAVELSDSRWDYDVRRLVEVIGSLAARPAPDSFAARAAAGFRSLLATWPRRLAAAGLLAAAAYAAYLYSGGANPPHDDGKILPTPEPPLTYEQCLDRLRAPGIHEAEVDNKGGAKPLIWSEDYGKLVTDQPGGLPILARLRDEGRDIGVVSLRYFKGEEQFRVELVAAPPCALVDDYGNADHTDYKRVLTNWDRLRVRLGGRSYLMRVEDYNRGLRATLTTEGETPAPGK